jgi:hypothetical protein
VPAYPVEREAIAVHAASMEREIISRSEAKALGLKTYFTGKPCKYGHVAERAVGGRHCCECERAYQRQYYSANREELAAQNLAYRLANREKEAARHRAYYVANREKERAYQRAYCLARQARERARTE